MLGDIVLRLYDETPIHPERRSSGSQFYIVWGQVYNEGQLRQFSKQLRMQKVQAVFNELAAEHRAEIMQMRRDRDRVGLHKLQDKCSSRQRYAIPAIRRRKPCEQLTIP